MKETDPKSEHEPSPNAADDESINEFRQSLSSPYSAPRNDLERALAAIWREGLGIAQVGIDDDFLELGGNSLLAIEIAARIRNLLAVEFLVHDFMRHSTVARQAAVIAQTLAALADDQILTDLAPPAGNDPGP